MPKITLTDTRVRALKPRKSTYHIRDAKLKGFGVRVLPSGAKRFFLHAQHRGQRSWNLVGDASAMAVAGARARAASILATFRGNAPADTPPFEAVAEAVFRRYARVWKPQTLYVNRSYYRCTLAPLVRRTLYCRHRPTGGRALVRLAAGHTGVGRPHGSPPRGVEPLPGHSALPAQGTQAVVVGCGDAPACGDALCTRGRMAASGRSGAAAASHRMPPQRGAHASLVGLPRRTAVPA